MRNPSGQPDSGASSLVSAPSTNLKRRRFLFSAGGASVAAAVTAVPAAAAVVAPATPAKQPTASGYQDTEHVRKYYSTTRL